jgi:hypothetical protein
MKYPTNLGSFALFLFTTAACASSPTGDSSSAASADPTGVIDSASKVCFSGVGVRPSEQPTPTAAVQDLWTAWQAAMADYQQAAAAFSVEAEDHADAFEAAAGGIAGAQCTSDLDCDTQSTEFIGSCRIYYNVGQCNIVDQDPLPVGPTAPPQPSLTCADFTCDASFQCEQEVNTTGIACVLQNCGNGGGGGGSGSGGGGGGGGGGGSGH